jgi:hypothetical protein
MGKEKQAIPHTHWHRNIRYASGHVYRCILGTCTDCLFGTVVLGTTLTFPNVAREGDTKVITFKRA